MVDAGRAELTGELDAGAEAELVAVDPEPESAGPARLEDRAGLVAVEGVRRVRLAEHVDVCRWARVAPIGEEGVEHGSRDEVDVVAPSVGVLGRHDVRTEEGRVGGELAGDPQRAQLVLDGEAVAALDLHRRRALRPGLGDAGGDEGPQLVVGRGAGRGDGDRDAATVVGPSRHPRGELGGAVAREDEVRVGVDEAGDQRAAAEVTALVGVGRLRRGADPFDERRPGPVRAWTAHDEGRVADDSQETVAGISVELPPDGVVGDELGDPREQQAHEPTAAVTTRSIDEPRRRPTSPSRCWPSRTTMSPPTTTVETSEATQE